MRHDCETCETCLHNGNKCCGCYDGACCQEWCDRAPHDDRCVQPYCSGGRSFTVEPDAGKR